MVERQSRNGCLHNHTDGYAFFPGYSSDNIGVIKSDWSGQMYAVIRVVGVFENVFVEEQSKGISSQLIGKGMRTIIE